MPLHEALDKALYLLSPSDWLPAWFQYGEKHLLLAAISIGVGIAAWKYGRAVNSGRHMLMSMPFFVYAFVIPDIAHAMIAGFTLFVLLFWP